LFGLAPGGVCRAASVAGSAVRPYRTVSPLPRLKRNAPRRSILCCTIPGVLPPPDVIRHRLSMEPGLSSPAAFRHWLGAAVQPTDGIGMGIQGESVKTLIGDGLKNWHEVWRRSFCLSKWRGPCFDQRAQGQERRRIGNAIDARLPKMPLECCNDTARGIVIAPCIRNSVAVRAQRALEPCHRVTAVSRHQTSSLEIELGGAHAVSNSGFAKKTRGELLARILLARRRHIRVGENAIRAEGSPSRDDRFTDRNYRSDLPQWIIGVTKFMAWVHNLNTDRTRINVGIVSPN